MSRAVLFVVLSLAIAGCQALIDFGSGEAGTVDAGAADALAVDAGDAAAPGDAAPPPDGSVIDSGADAPVNTSCVVPENVQAACPPPLANPADCPETTAGVATTWNGHCYFRVSQFSTFSKASTWCKGLNAHLATFTCADEWTNVYPIVTSNGIYAMLGAISAGNHCQWNATNEPWTYAPWAPASLDGGVPIDTCVWGANDGHWVSVSCAATSAYPLCERE